MVDDIKPALLTQGELDFLLGKIQVSPDYARQIKSRVNRKIKTFFELELPLVQNSAVTASSHNVTANCHTTIAQPSQSEGRVNHEIDNNMRALDGIRTHDLRFTKPSLCQAELLGRNAKWTNAHANL